MKRLIMFMVVVGMAGCASPHIGKSVNPNGSYLCRHWSLPAKCSTSTGDLVFQYEITAESQPDEYTIKGRALAATIPGGWTDFMNARFNLLLVNDNVVTESIGMAGGRGSLGKDITFSRTFTYKEEFDASLITWSMTVTE